MQNKLSKLIFSMNFFKKKTIQQGLAEILLAILNLKKKK